MISYLANPSLRVQPGYIAFLRVKVVGITEVGVAVQLVDKFGRPTDNITRYVEEKQIVTVAEAIKAVNG